jgi:transcriptional regulator
MGERPLALLQGTVDLLILKTLAGGALHGYAVSQWIAHRTGGTLALDDAALYQALHRLEEKGWIKAEWGLSENNRRARFYTLTAAGRRRMAASARDWRRYADAVFAVLDAPVSS